MISEQEIKQRIMAAFPDAKIVVQDLTGGQDHYQVEVISEAFTGLAPLARHRKVYAVFHDVMGGALHALSLNTKTPQE